MGKLQDKIAVVTGSSSGNGRAIAIALAAEGASVVCSDIRREAREGGYEGDILTPTDDVIRANGGKAEHVEADAGSYSAVENLVAAAVNSFGRLDVMVNNAGISTGLHTIVDETEDEYDRTMLVNGKSVWLGCKFAIKQMLTQEPIDGSRGRVVNIASVDFAPERINVNAVCPGFLATAMVRPFLDDPELNKVLHDKSPWPELGTAEDVARATVFLGSSDARWATGSLLTIDGGYVAP
ncbi:MAG: putative short chain dehydrogenase [Pseudonocardia sp.]|jgi:NAD(P)-dependent dehydrogenase (short-subunit alcohol dehydrogenase family)|uniref:SDR family NAD(P)-dependent oxidoreductase n=1 Tax=Pseudonocardia sp. TaxID=60912 RepID=UPI002625CFC4|nr:SDR family oxidoreductase [Pseudonocardia sp.]MCU1631037.1 putative short chain dehydrogenase [Pseudonocardia sp.]